MPRIEGIDDVEEKPKKKSDVQFIQTGLLGTGKKDYSDQADDILADTFDVEQRAEEERKKRLEAQQKLEEQDQNDFFDEALGSVKLGSAGSTKNVATEMQK